MENYKTIEILPDDNDDEMSLLDVLIVLAEQKKLIALVVLLFTLAGVISAFCIIKPKYLSEVQMMTVSSSVIDRAMFSVQMHENIVGGIIMSNSMMDAVINEFGLLNKNGKNISRIEARRKLAEDIKVDANKNGLVTLKVETHNPEKSMNMANFIYQKTDEALQQVGISATVASNNGLLEKTITEKFAEIENVDTPQNDASKVASILELYALISQYSENQKIKDKNPIVLQLISPPTMPDEKAPQGRGKIIALSTLLGFFCALTMAFMRHSWNAWDDDPVAAEKKALLRRLLGTKTE
ncbi:hypothetical protein LJC40_01435 [Synergistaceae bacterium OttesenSCG-928-D05]|nr:hypothetical protein [Synergistaceae bacterium OttesenSCG-928-D05]